MANVKMKRSNNYRKPNRNFHGKKKKKLELVFDPKARKDFLSGFHKRKEERRKRAKEELENELKEEKRRIRSQAKEKFKKFTHTKKAIPDFEDLFSEDIDMGTHSVKITKLSTAELAKENNWIGENQVQYEEDIKDEDDTDHSGNDDVIEGMEMPAEKKAKGSTSEDGGSNFSNVKQLKRAIRHEATEKLLSSKPFKMKQNLERMKNIQEHKKQKRIKAKKERKKERLRKIKKKKKKMKNKKK